MNPRITAAFVASIATAQLTAQDGAKLPSYQFEFGAGWSQSTTDTSPDIEINQYLVSGTYHLKPVALADHPWSEAAFLEHSTSVTASLAYAEFEAGGFSADGPLFGASVVYAEKETPFAAAFSFSVGTLDGDGGIDIDRTAMNARVGWWLMPNALIGAEVGRQEIEAGGMLDVEETRIGAFGKLVHDLREGRAVNAEVRFGVASVDDSVSDEDNIEFGLAGDFYFTPKYSAGVLLGLSSGDAASEEGTTLGVRGQAWFNPQVAAGVVFSTFNADDSSGADVDTIAVFLNLRF
jgi:hypothetical protein